MPVNMHMRAVRTYLSKSSNSTGAGGTVLLRLLELLLLCIDAFHGRARSSGTWPRGDRTDCPDAGSTAASPARRTSRATSSASRPRSTATTRPWCVGAGRKGRPAGGTTAARKYSPWNCAPWWGLDQRFVVTFDLPTRKQVGGVGVEIQAVQLKAGGAVGRLAPSGVTEQAGK